MGGDLDLDGIWIWLRLLGRGQQWGKEVVRFDSACHLDGFSNGSHDLDDIDLLRNVDLDLFGLFNALQASLSVEAFADAVNDAVIAHLALSSGRNFVSFGAFFDTFPVLCNARARLRGDFPLGLNLFVPHRPIIGFPE